MYGIENTCLYRHASMLYGWSKRRIGFKDKRTIVPDKVNAYLEVVMDS